MDRAERMGKENIGPLLFKFSLPAVIGMMVTALYNVVDRIFIGQAVGADAMAGLGISFPIMIIIMAFSMLIGIGGTALISLHLGKQEREEAEEVLGNAMMLMIVTGLILMTLGLIFLNPLLRFFGASETVLPYSRGYLSIILYGAVVQMISFGLNRFIGAEGNATMAMKTMIIGGITNIILDAAFIIGLGMGIQGAAIATIIAQTVTALWVLSYFLRGKSVVRFHKKNFGIHWRVVKRIFAIGSAPFAMQLASCVIIILYNKTLMEHGGDIAVSTYTIINSITMFIFMPVFGINQGCQPIIGYNYGAKQYDRVLKTLFLGSVAASVIVIAGFILCQFAPALVVMVYSRQNPELLAVATDALKKFSLMFPIIGFQIICSNYFQAAGKPGKAMFLSLTRQVIFLIPTIIILPMLIGLDGAWYAAPISDTLSAVVTTIAIAIEIRLLKSYIKEQENPVL